MSEEQRGLILVVGVVVLAWYLSKRTAAVAAPAQPAALPSSYYPEIILPGWQT